MLHNGFKKIKFEDTEVVITHFIKDEYNEHDYNKSYTFKKFKTDILKSYDLAIKLNLCSIININNDSIKIKMPKYIILLHDLNNNIKTKTKFIQVFCGLLHYMWSNKIIHMDFAFRNIGIDDNNNFKLIDLNEISECYSNKDFYEWFSYIKTDFLIFSILDYYIEIEEYVVNKIMQMK